MMAAAQPFLSGAISKTVNLPETATVEEIEDVYLQSWKLGLKATAIYRDNCKVGQPLSDGRARPRRTRPTRPRPPRPSRPRSSRRSSTPRSASACRSRAPSPTTSFTVGGAEGYMTAGCPRRRPRRGLPQARQAGLDPGRRDGRLLDRGLDRPAVRRPAGDLRLEVHQPALRARRPHRRPGRPDGAVDHGLHLPPPGPGLPALREPLELGIYSAEERQRHLETGSYEPLVEETGSRCRARRGRAGRRRSRRGRRGRRDVETKDTHGSEDREVPAKAAPARPTPPPSSSRRSPAPPSTPRSA